MTALQIEHWKIGKVIKYARNSRTHSAEQIQQIKASMKEFGFVNPCLVDAKGILIAGHGRVEAASQLGMKTVPVIKLGHLSEVQSIALRIADNSIAQQSGWDPTMLQTELATLEEMNFDLAPLGLDAIELPPLDDAPGTEAPARQRTKTTLFVSVKNADAPKARRAIIAALNKAQVEHNL